MRLVLWRGNKFSHLIHMANKKMKKKMKTTKKSVGAKRPKRRVPHAAKRHSASARAKRPVAKLSRRAVAKPTLIPKGKSQDRVSALIRLGKERGYITYDEILREFPTIEDNVLLLEEMYEKFST